jgi:hypothetical protein
MDVRGSFWTSFFFSKAVVGVNSRAIPVKWLDASARV